MRKRALAVAVATVWLGPAAGDAQPVRYDGADDAPPIAVAEPNSGPVWLRPGSGYGPVARFTADPAAGYAVATVPIRADRPQLIVIAHDPRMSLAARLLDAPPWADPRVVQPIRLEPRRAAGNRLLEAAWLIARPGTPARDGFLLIETRGSGEVGVEVYDPFRPAPFRSLARQWSGGRTTGALASPLEQQERRSAQLVRDWPDTP